MSRAASLVVVYDYGSIAPLRLAEAAAVNGCTLVFVLADSAHAREMVPALELLGAVVDLACRTEAAVADELRAFTPSGIVTFSESCIPVTARLAAALGLPYHDTDHIGPIVDKEQQRRRLRAAGVDSVRFRRVGDAGEIASAIAEVGLPAVVKPTTGASSRYTTHVHTVAAANQALIDVLRQRRTALIEELLPGRPVESPWADYVAVDCVALDGDVRPVFVTSKFALAAPFRERGGYGQRSTLSDGELRAAEDLARRAIAAVGIRHGIADVELKLTPAGPRVIEVNGRLGGWVDDLAVRSAAANPAVVAINAALGQDVPQPCTAWNDLIAFHYLLIPPMSATRVRSVSDGLYGLLALPSVDRVSVMKRPGEDVRWLTGTDSSVAAVLGTAADHDQLARLIGEIEQVEWIEYEHADLGEDHAWWPVAGATR